MAQDYGTMIDVLIISNTQLLKQMRAINDRVDRLIEAQPIDSVSLRQALDEVEILQKRIQDNTATINDYAYKTQNPDSFFQEIEDNFFKKVNYVSDSISQILVKNTTVENATVVFSNAGMFYSWTFDKHIKLRLTITDVNNNIYLQQTFDFNIAREGNYPGNEGLNEDYMKRKYFDVSFTVPDIIGSFNILFEVIDDIYTFNNSLKKYVNIIA